jgi:hypothetical protein
MSVASLHRVVRDQFARGRDPGTRLRSDQLQSLASNERKATETMRRRLRRALGRSIVPPAGTAVWG